MSCLRKSVPRRLHCQLHMRRLATKRQKRTRILTSAEPSLSINPQQLILPSHVQQQQQQLASLELRKNLSISQIYEVSDQDDVHLENLVTMTFDPSVHLPSAPTDWSDYEPETPLGNALMRQIGVTGKPISVAEFMRQALVHPEYGYYTHAVTNSDAVDDFDVDDYDQEELDKINDKNLIIGADFVTSPEISNLFGESLALWFALQHNAVGDVNENNSGAVGKEWQFVECGPGRGTLMVDMMRFVLTTSQPMLRAFGRSCRHVHFVEASPVLRELQRENLQREIGTHVHLEFYDDQDKTVAAESSPYSASKTKEQGDRQTISVFWHDSFTAFQLWQLKVQGNNSNNNPLPSYIVCQEFIDALPVYAFEKNNGVWRERLVDVALRDDCMEPEDLARLQKQQQQFSSSGLSWKKPRFRIVLAPDATLALEKLLGTDGKGNLPKDSILNQAPDSSVIEVCPEGILLVQEIARVVEKQGGAALIIDYGQEGSSDSIRAFTKHEQVHFLSRPGQVDVTADVDFGALRGAVNRNSNSSSSVVENSEQQVAAFGPVTQGDFLMSMGIQDRVVRLIEDDDVGDELAENIYNSFMRLVSQEEMGGRYKVLSISKARDEAPPGF